MRTSSINDKYQIDHKPFKSKISAMNPYRYLSMVRDPNAIYANISDVSYKDSLGNVFFTKAVMNGPALTNRASFIPPVKALRNINEHSNLRTKNIYVPPVTSGTFYANNPDLSFHTLTPYGYMPKKRIFGALAGLFGVFKPPTTQSTSIKFDTSVSESISFRNSVASLNESISNYILSQTQVTLSDISQVANYNIVDLFSNDSISINLNNDQEISVLNINKMDITAVNKYVLEAATNIFSDILNKFEATNVGTLNILNTASKNSNLIDSIFGAAPRSDVNINTVINTNTSVETAYKYEKEAVYKTISQSSNINQFAQKIQSQLAQVFNVTIQNVNSNQKIDVVITNKQKINSILQLVAKIDLATSTFTAINTSDSFSIDSSVFSNTQQVASTQTSQTNAAENVGSAILAAGDAAANTIGSAASFIATSSLWLIAPALLIGGGLIWYMFSAPDSPSPEESDQSDQSNTLTNPSPVTNPNKDYQEPEDDNVILL